MSTHNICFPGELRKISAFFREISIFHGEISIFHGEISIFHGEIRIIYQHFSWRIKDISIFRMKKVPYLLLCMKTFCIFGV